MYRVHLSCSYKLLAAFVMLEIVFQLEKIDSGMQATIGQEGITFLRTAMRKQAIYIRG
jgi:hypothetical protein